MSASQVVTRTYNALGQLTESDWQGEKWRISYDERGLVESVDWFDPDPTAIGWKSVANYERELIGLPLARNTDFGQTRSFTYDVLARPLTDNVNLDGISEMLAERSYDYSGAGNLENVTGHTNNVIADATYTYDLQNRLLTANAPNGYEGNFTYSATGNVLSADVEWNNAAETRNVSYSYGQVDPQAVDELLNIATGDSYAEFAYDDVGNMTWRSAPDGETLLHWDGQDQIRRVDSPDGSETYYYDHAGQRMLVVNADQGVRFWFGEREIHYNLDGTETLNYLHLSAGGPTLARVENDTEIELQYADALQNLMFSLDKDSEVIASFLYGPFGEVVLETGGEEHRRQFNGKENDVATGLRYYGYRYYDPVTLRWNSADPIYSFLPDLGLNEPQLMNLYAFSLNNPVRYYDPDGLDANDGKGGGSSDPMPDCGDGDTSDDDCFGMVIPPGETESAKNAAFVKEMQTLIRHLDLAVKDNARRQRSLINQGRNEELLRTNGRSDGVSVRFRSDEVRIAGMPNWRGLLVRIGLRAVPTAGAAGAGTQFLHKNSSTVAVVFRNGVVKLANTPFISHREYAKRLGALVNEKLVDGAVPVTILKNRLGEIHVLGSEYFGGTLNVPNWAIALGKGAVR